MVFVKAIKEGAPGTEKVPEITVQKESLAMGRPSIERMAHQNSSKPMVPLRSVSNILIIIFIVWGSNAVQSPFTNAIFSSVSDNCPFPLLSTALKRRKREASALLLRPGAGVAGGREMGGERRLGF